MVEGGPLRKFLLTCYFWDFPQPVSLSFFRPKFEGLYPATLGYIDIEFTRYVDTLSGCYNKFSKSGVTPKFVQGGSNFQVGPHCRPHKRTNVRT